MTSTLKFKLIMVFVDDRKIDPVIDAGRAAGATGATIIPHARGQGMMPQLTFFGLEFLAACSIVLLVVEARRARAVMEAVSLAGGLDESANTGIALEIDVSSVEGLSEHIRILEREVPLDPAP